MICSDKIFTPVEYVEMVTGKHYEPLYSLEGEKEWDFEFISTRLANHEMDLWDYPLCESDYVLKEDINVVLVDCSNYSEDMRGIRTPRWFEIPDEIVEDIVRGIYD